MTLSNILSSALSGLNAAEAGLATVSNNIANAETPGYARQSVPLSAGILDGAGAGVRTGTVERIANRYLEESVWRLNGTAGAAEAEAAYQDRMQALFGDPASAGSLNAQLDAVSAAAIRLNATPALPAAVDALTGAIDGAMTAMQGISADISQLRADVDGEITATVDSANRLLARIHKLNGQIVQRTAMGETSAGPADQRAAALEELSRLIAINPRVQPDGRISIESAHGAMLLDYRLRQLDYPGATGGTVQPDYPPITIRFADGSTGVAAGERIADAAIGGTLGGLIGLRDQALPQVADQLGGLFSGLANAINSASNAASTSPAPARLDGRPTGLVGSDRLGFAGVAVFAVTASDGTLLSRATIDFSALGPAATLDDGIAAINAALGGAASASLSADGALHLTATASGTGVAVAGGQPAAMRAGTGFSQFFGLNDLIRADGAPLVPSGLAAGDPHGFASGQSAQLVLRDADGRLLGSHVLTPQSGGTMADLVADLNGSPLSAFGAFSLNADGRFAFQPAAGRTGAMLSIPLDSTDRAGTGIGFAALSGLTGADSGLNHARLNPERASSAAVPLALFDTGAAIGTGALGAGDVRMASALVDALAAPRAYGALGTGRADSIAARLMGEAGARAADANARLAAREQALTGAVARRDAVSAVNLDEELAHMVVLQNSYAAAARVINSARDMYDTLLSIV